MWTFLGSAAAIAPPCSDSDIMLPEVRAITAMVGSRCRWQPASRMIAMHARLTIERPARRGIETIWPCRGNVTRMRGVYALLVTLINPCRFAYSPHGLYGLH